MTSQLKTVNCNVCGANVNINPRGKCEYCESTLDISSELIKTACKEFKNQANFKNRHKSFVKNLIFTEKLGRALGIGPSEEVYLSYDATTFRTGRQGFAITSKGFYCRVPLASTHFLSHEQFLNTVLSFQQTCDVYADEKEIAFFPGLNKLGEEWFQLYKQIQGIIRIYSKEKNKVEHLEPQELNTLGQCKLAITNYLRENVSTPFFREKLTEINDRIDAFHLRCDNANALIVKRFGTSGISYSKFAATVFALQEYLVLLLDNLISKMRIFHEEEYSQKIDGFLQENREREAAGYLEVNQDYQDYAKRTLLALEDAILKLDQLTLELSKLYDSEVEQAMDIMDEVDAVIQHTPLYK